MTSKQALSKLMNMAAPYYWANKEQIELVNIVEKDLEQLEKLEKVIKILKHKIEFENLGEMQSGCMFRGYFNDCFDEKEFETIKDELL